jgi:hypothetical protein
MPQHLNLFFGWAYLKLECSKISSVFFFTNNHNRVEDFKDFFSFVVNN